MTLLTNILLVERLAVEHSHKDILVYINIITKYFCITPFICIRVAVFCV